MKFLIIGASGFVGRCALEFLERAGCDVTGTRATSTDRRLVPFDLAVDRIEDALPGGFFETGGPVWVAVFSAISQLDRCRRERQTSRLINVDKTIELIDDLSRLDARPVFISSSYVFDGVTGGYDESAEPAPINEYGRQKLEVERHLAAHRPEALVLRLDKMVGDNPASTHLFTEWQRWITEKKPITCIADQVLSPTLADDVGHALLLAARQNLGGIYHVANPEAYERADLARQFARAAGSDVEVISRPMSDFRFDDPRPLKSYLDASRFIAATGMRFTPMHDVFQAFLSRLDAFKSA